MQSLYPLLDECSWTKVLELNRPALPRPPFSVHCPLNFSGAKNIVIVDGALNASVLAMPPALDSNKPEDYTFKQNLRTRTLTFLPDDIPAIMDFHHAKMERIEGDLPQIKGSFYTCFTQYTFLYAMGDKERLSVRASIRNEGRKRERKHLWLKLAHPLERDFYNYHYNTFHFTEINFPKFDTSCDCHDGALWHDGKAVLRHAPGGFQVEWHPAVRFTDSQYTHRPFQWDSPFCVHPEFRVHSGRNFLHFSQELDPGEEASFELTFATDPDDTLPEQNPTFEETSRFNRGIWRGQEEERKIAQVDFGNDELNHRFQTVQRVTRQLMLTMDWPDYGKILFPCQGGTSERFFMWVWEAMCAFHPMMKLGFFEENRRLLEFIFSLQDGGYPPIGEFVKAPGAVGTTGPKWACTTGSALTWAAQYIRLSGDRDFAKKHLDAMAKACGWILAQIRAPHPPEYPYPGLMPKCCATDADYGRLVIFTDNWACQGMLLTAELLREYHHPDAELFAREAARYRADLMACLKDLATPDGYVHRQIDESGQYCPGFTNCDSFAFFAYSGLLSLHDPAIRKFIRWCETNSCQNFFFGAMHEHLMYIGTAEQSAALVNMANGETKRAWSAIQTFERYGCTHDLFLTQERFDVDDPEHTSWQPNASNNGRLMDMELARIYLETDQKILVLSGFAPFELEEPHRHFSIHGLHTEHGLLDLEAQDGKVSLKWEKNPPALPVILPEGWSLVPWHDDSHPFQIS